ncbi:hypothetical protein [Salinisphaera hydrothermalis]|uniref:hypothetical protein n=1 Tax=Salinisphaera hydrothermalis TaxID=563188 RepID=UPI003342CB29
MVESVKKITSSKQQLAAEYEKARKKFRRSEYAENLLINESAEVQVRGVFDGVKSLNDLLSAISKSHALTFSLTTAQEREEIRDGINSLVSKLSDLNEVLESLSHKKSRIPDEKVLEFVNPDGRTQRIQFEEVFAAVESLKIKLRPLRQFFSDERVKDLEEQIQGLQRRKSKIESEIEALEAISEKASEIQAGLSDSEKSAQSIFHNLEEIEKNSLHKKERIDQQISSAQDQLQNFSEERDKFFELRNEAESNRKTVESFFNEIDARQAQLSQQQKSTESYLETLKSYEERNDKYLEIVQKIIADAESALQLSGEVSLGRHFSEYFESSKKGLWRWLVGGAAFLIAAIGLGIWSIVWSAHNGPITELVVRISLIPLTLLGAVFCATQYVKQKRLIEDYGHKKVLALSITSFRNQFEGTEYSDEGKAFLAHLLDQIYAHPLREKIGADLERKQMRKSADSIFKMADAQVRSEGKRSGD